MTYLGRGLQFLGYGYLLRVPMLTWVMLIALCLGSLPGSVAEPILRGIFDIASKQSNAFVTCIEFATVTLATLLAGTSMGVSARLVVCNAHARFRAEPTELTPGLELVFRFVPFVSFTALVGTALLRSDIAKLPMSGVNSAPRPTSLPAFALSKQLARASLDTSPHPRDT